jgi:hypothetical protein
MRLLAAVFIFALLAPARAAADPGSASVYYFDHDYRISSDLSQVIEEITSSTGSVKLQKAATYITYTNGAKFVIDRPEDLTADELARTTDYALESEVEVVQGGHSVVLMPQDLLDTMFPLIQDAMSAYFDVERVPARLLAGTSPSGIKFRAVQVSSMTEKPLWEPTLEIRHYAQAGGRDIVFTGVSTPMGLNGFSRKMVEEAADKKNAALLSLGMGGVIAGQVMKSGPEKTVGYLAAAGADVAALEPDDLNNFWRWSKDGPIKLSSASPEFICSNVDISTPPLQELIKPYAIRKIGGVTVAFISLLPANAAIVADLEGSPFTVRDPKDQKALYSLIYKLRGELKAHLVIAVATFLKEDEIGWLLDSRGIDALIGPKTLDSESGRSSRVDLRKWEKELHTGPALTVFPDSRGEGQIRIETGRRGALTAMEALPAPEDGREPLFYREQRLMKERIVRHLLGSGDTLLPDLRGLEGQGVMFRYSVPDFFNMAASLTRRKFGTEIAVVKVRAFSSSMLGDVPTAMVKTWLGPDKPMVTALVPGQFINDLRAKQVPDRNPDEYYTPQTYSGADYYALSGVDGAGRVAGLPIGNSEFYLTAMPAEMAEGRHFVKVLPAGPGAPKTLYTAVIGGLEELRKNAASRETWQAAVLKETRNKPEPRDLWRINLRTLSLSMVNTDVTGPEAYASINESRLSATNQTQMQGSGKLYSEYYSGMFRFDAGVSADYGKTVLRPRGQPHLTTESIDQLTYDSQLIYRWKNYDGKLGRLVVGPYASAAYDTEFSHLDSRPLKKIVRGSAGMKLFEGSVIQDLYAGLSTQQVYTYRPARTQYSLESGFRLSTPLPGTALVLNADGTYRNFARSRLDAVTDMKQTLELNLKVTTRLYGNVNISPYLNFFLAQGKKLPGSAYNLTTGFSLEFSRLFKLKR